MKMFSRKLNADVVRIYELEAQVERLRGLLDIEKERCAFFKDRGDRYMTLRHERDDEQKKLLEMTQEILLGIFKAPPVKK